MISASGPTSTCSRRWRTRSSSAPSARSSPMPSLTPKVSADARGTGEVAWGWVPGLPAGRAQGVRLGEARILPPPGLGTLPLSPQVPERVLLRRGVPACQLASAQEVLQEAEAGGPGPAGGVARLHRWGGGHCSHPTAHPLSVWGPSSQLCSPRAGSATPCSLLEWGRAA